MQSSQLLLHYNILKSDSGGWGWRDNKAGRVLAEMDLIPGPNGPLSPPGVITEYRTLSRF